MIMNFRSLFISQALPGRGRPRTGLVGAGRGWSGLVGSVTVYVPLSESLGSSGISGIPILWIIGVIQLIIGVNSDN